MDAQAPAQVFIPALLGALLLCISLVATGCGQAAGLAPGNFATNGPADPPVNHPPVVAGAPASVAFETTPYSFQAIATDPDNDVITFALTVAPAGMTVDAAGLVLWTPAVGQAGDHGITLTANDGAAAADLNWTIHVLQSGTVGIAPTITSTEVTVATEGLPYSYQIVAAGTPAPTISAAGLPSWLAFDGIDTLSGAPTDLDVGTSGTLTVTASNGLSPDATQSFTIAVSPAVAGDAPMITSVALKIALVGQPYSYSVVATGTPAPTISVSGHPAWLSITGGGTIMGTPDFGDAGTTGVMTVTASNGLSPDATQQFTILVVSDWEITVVDETGDVGMFTSLALDSNGAGHVAYYDAANDDLKYNSNGPGSWYAATLRGDGDVGQYSSLALDAANTIHIAYYDKTNGDLMYITSAPVWTSQAIDTTGNVGSSANLKLDAAGKVHIVYRDITHNYFKYATNATPSGAWEVEVAGDGGNSSCLALDNAGKAHVCCLNGGNVRHFTKNAAGSWEGEVIEATNASWGIAATASPGGAIHVAYYADADTHLHYATNASGSWVVEVADDANVAGCYPSIALDAAGKVHLAYRLGVYTLNSNTAQLKYATNAFGAWTSMLVDADYGTGLWTSAAVGSDGKVHIAYHDKTNQRLKYAKMR